MLAQFVSFQLNKFICFQIHWSSVLLSLVSKCVFALLIILSLGLFVRVVIKRCIHAESNINSSPEVLEKTNLKTDSTAIEADFCSNENQKVYWSKHLVWAEYPQVLHMAHRNILLKHPIIWNNCHNHRMWHFTSDLFYLSNITRIINMTITKEMHDFEFSVWSML